MIDNIAKIQNIVWFHTGFLGDIVLLSGAMHLVDRQFPEKKQYLVSTKIGVQALAHLRFLKACLTVQKGKGEGLIRQIQGLRRGFNEWGLHRRHSIILRAHGSVRSSLLCLGTGVRTVSHQEGACPWFSSALAARVAVFHEARRLAMLLEPLGIAREEILSAKPCLQAFPDNPLKRENIGYSPRARLVAVAPGSVWGTKRWPAGHFSRLICQLLKREDLHVLLIGSPDEGLVAKKILAYVRAAASSEELLSLSDLTGKTSLDDLRGLYPQLSLLISNDSSPTHYASAFDVPVLTLFGATVPAMGFYPLSRDHACAEVSNLACRPCSDHGPKYCPLGHFRCMKQLSPGSVLARCDQLLGPPSKTLFQGAKTEVERRLRERS